MANDAELLILLEPSVPGDLVGVHRASGSEGEVGEPEVRAPRVGERVTGDGPVALQLQERPTRLAVDDTVRGTLEHRRIPTAAPGVGRADSVGDSVRRHLPDGPAIAARDDQVALGIDRDLSGIGQRWPL